MGRAADLLDLVHDRLADDDEASLEDWVSESEPELDELEAPVQVNETFPNVAFVCNLPKVGKEKYDKLMGVLGKLINKYGENEKYMPINEETGQTDGFIIVTFNKVEDCDNCVATMDGMKLDKSHDFKVVKIDNFDKITSRSEEFTAKTTIEAFSRSDFRTWLEDQKCREQILLRYQSETEIYWNDLLAGQPVLCYGGEREKRQKKIWCDWTVHWSPLGSYLVTVHKQGIALWAGPEFTKRMRFAHVGVKHLEFTRNEEFVLTWNGSHPTEGDESAVRIFCVLTGKLMKQCRTPTMTPLKNEFPHFLWSNDGKYYAECNQSSISVRDTNAFDLIRDEDGKRQRLKFENLDTFQWSPKDNILAVWSLEKDNNPARLVLVEIPSRRELASRSRTQVEASMHWQSEGDYICLLVEKLSKTKKKCGTNLEIFRVRERNIPVDIVEVKDTVHGFFWETKGNRFGVLTKDDVGHRPKLLFYMLGKEKCELVYSFDLPSNSFTNLHWAPDGQYWVCSAIGGGDILFGSLTAENRLEILHKDEHFMVTEVLWDPSSRYVITTVTQPMQDGMGGFRYSMEASYAIWTFQGRPLFRQHKEKLYQIAWRPHPESLISESQQRHIRKNIRQFSKKYDALDDQAKEAARQAFRAERDAKTAVFREALDRLEDYKKEEMDGNGWAEAWEEYFEGQGWENEEQTMEEELSCIEELISG